MGTAAFFSSTAWIALIGTAYVALQHMDQRLRAWRQVQWSVSRQRWREALEALPAVARQPAAGLCHGLAAAVCALRALRPPITGQLNSFNFYLCLHLLRDCLLLTGFVPAGRQAQVTHGGLRHCLADLQTSSRRCWPIGWRLYRRHGGAAGLWRCGWARPDAIGKGR